MLLVVLLWLSALILSTSSCPCNQHIRHCVRSNDTPKLCVCQPGFRFEPAIMACVPTAPTCSPANDACGTNQTCTLDGQFYVCSCARGFSNKQGPECQDTNECLSNPSTSCPAGSTCINTPGGFQCLDRDECAEAAQQGQELCRTGVCLNVVGTSACFQSLAPVQEGYVLLDWEQEPPINNTQDLLMPVGTVEGLGRTAAFFVFRNLTAEHLRGLLGARILVGMQSDVPADLHDQFTLSFLSVSNTSPSTFDAGNAAFEVLNLLQAHPPGQDLVVLVQCLSANDEDVYFVTRGKTAMEVVTRR